MCSKSSYSLFSARVSTLCLTALLLALQASAVAASIEWKITDLGPVSSGSQQSRFPRDINDQGTILFSTPQVIQGLVFQPQRLNNSGQILGTVNNVPYLLDGGTLTNLGAKGLAWATALNDSAMVAGAGYTPSFTAPAVLNGDQLTVYGGLASLGLGIVGGGGEVYFQGINNSAQVLGQLNSGGGVVSAFLIENNGIVSLGLDGDFSIGNEINDLGAVVGTATTERNIMNHAFLYHDGKTIDLGTLGGAHSWARDINNKSQVIGQSDTNFLTLGTSAFFWEAGMMVDLSELAEVKLAGWEILENASAINNRGQIVGYGRLGGAYHGFLLSPVPEPASLAMLLVGLAVVVGVARRRANRLAPDKF